MTIIELLRKAGAAGDDLLSFLNMAAQRFPDLAPKAQELAIALQAAITEANLVSVASVLPKEIADIAKGHLEPSDRPSDSI